MPHGIGLVFNIMTTIGTFVCTIQMNLTDVETVNDVEYVTCDSDKSIIQVNLIQV